MLVFIDPVTETNQLAMLKAPGEGRKRLANHRVLGREVRWHQGRRDIRTPSACSSAATRIRSLNSSLG